jgi:hypothetical protein
MSIRVASVNGASPEQTPFQITMIPNWENNTYLLVENGIVTGLRPGVDPPRRTSTRVIGNQSLVVPDTSLIIPATLWAESVTAIGNDAFKGKKLGGVVIPNGVTAIGNNAFADNILSHVVIPDSVTTIGNRAFYHNGLRDVVIGKGVTSIADNAFVNNPFQTGISPGPRGSISIPGNVTFVPVLTYEERNAVDRDHIWIRFMEIYGRNVKKGGNYTIGSGIGNWRYSPE